MIEKIAWALHNQAEKTFENNRELHSQMNVAVGGSEMPQPDANSNHGFAHELLTWRSYDLSPMQKLGLGVREYLNAEAQRIQLGFTHTDEMKPDTPMPEMIFGDNTPVRIPTPTEIIQNSGIYVDQPANMLKGYANNTWRRVQERHATYMGEEHMEYHYSNISDERWGRTTSGWERMYMATRAAIAATTDSLMGTFKITDQDFLNKTTPPQSDFEFVTQVPPELKREHL